LTEVPMSGEREPDGEAATDRDNRRWTQWGSRG
jgi:hypothetical protein